MTPTDFITQKLILYNVGVFVISLFITYSIFPVVFYLNHTKKFSVKPNNRSSHIDKIPTLGGIPIYIAFIISTSSFIVFTNNNEEIASVMGLRTALTILFFVGVKDDLLGISSKKKLFIQIVAATLLILMIKTKINSFYGIFNIYTLPVTISYFVTIFVFVIIINSYNLIDGIDGLSASFAIICFMFFGIYFILNNAMAQSLICFSSIGGLIVFLKYNISKTRKIFMGDTGTMTIGLILAYLAIMFLSINESITTNYTFKNPTVVLIALFLYPLIDTARIFTVRILNKKSPFKADKNHIHHKILSLGFTHLQSSSIIILFSLFMLCISFIFENESSNVHFLMVISIGIFIIGILFFVDKKNNIYKITIPHILQKVNENLEFSKSKNFKQSRK